MNATTVRCTLMDREARRDVEFAMNYYESELGSATPREGEAVAHVDAEWLSRLLKAYSESRRVRLEIRDLALGAGFAVLDEWPQTIARRVADE